MLYTVCYTAINWGVHAEPLTHRFGLNSPKYEQTVGFVRMPQDGMHVAVVTAQDCNKREVSDAVNVCSQSGGVSHVDTTRGDNLQNGLRIERGYNIATVEIMRASRTT